MKTKINLPQAPKPKDAIPGCRARSAMTLHPPRNPLRFRRAAAALGLVVLAGCQIGPRNFENENDRLRAQNLALRQEVEALEDRLELRLGELETLRQQVNPATQPGADVPQGESPVLSRLEFDRLSGPVDEDGDEADDLIRVYLEPQDQRGRLLPVAGRAVVRAVTIPAEGEPTLLAERVYEPEAFESAWRSGITGRHYTLELPLPEPLPEHAGDVTVKVTFTQANTGHQLTAQQPMTLRR